MTNEQFMKMYDNYLLHAGHVYSKDPAKYAEQKQREKEYNAWYYRTYIAPKKEAEAQAVFDEINRLGEEQKKTDADKAAAIFNEINSLGKEQKRKESRNFSPEEAKAYLDQVQANIPDNPFAGASKQEKSIIDSKIASYEKQGFTKQEATDIVAVQYSAAKKASAYDKEMYLYGQQKKDRISKQNAARAASYADAAKTTQNVLSTNRQNFETAQAKAAASAKNKMDSQSRNMNASYAQQRAASQKRNTAVSRNRNVAASNAQAQAAATKRQNRTLQRRSASDTNASVAQMQAAQNRRNSWNKTENKIARTINKSATKVNNMINNGKAAVATISDAITGRIGSIKNAVNSVSRTLKKYFG